IPSRRNWFLHENNIADFACAVIILCEILSLYYARLSNSADQASSMMAFNVLPPFVGSLFVVALISAIMSNVNSILLVASAGLSHDIYGKMINPRAPDRHKLFLNRASIILLSVVPVWFAL